MATTSIAHRKSAVNEIAVLQPRNLIYRLLLVVPLFLTGCGISAHGLNTQGVKFFQQGEYQAALEQFQRAMNTDPYNADGYYNTASTYHRMGIKRQDRQLLEQSETLYNQCLDFDANHVECHRGLAVLLIQTDRRKEAFKLMEQWATREPPSAEARIELARLHHEAGDLETASLQLQQALAIDSRNPRAWTAMGHLRDQSGDTAQALANYQRSFALNRKQPAVAHRIAAISQSLESSTPNGTGEDTRMVNSESSSPR
tara:strand:- start:206 stop:976 length:771 start_codon:yes stop_codon:yes gene_type:complete